MDVTSIVTELVTVQHEVQNTVSRISLNYDTFQKLLKSMDTEFDRSVARSLLASLLRRNELYNLGMKPDRVVGKLSSVLEAATEVEDAVSAADELVNSRLRDKLDKINCRINEIHNQVRSKKTKSDLNDELELYKLRMDETNGLLNKETTNDTNKFSRARKRLTIQLLEERRIKKRKLGAGRPLAMDEEDEQFLAKCIAEKSMTHGRRHDTVVYLNHRVKKRHFLSLANYNLLRRGKKLIRSATTVYNRSRPNNIRSNAAKQHRGKWLFCCKKPPKTEDNSVETTHYQRAHVKNAKFELAKQSPDSSLICSMDDKAYLRPGTDGAFNNDFGLNYLLMQSILHNAACTSCSLYFSISYFFINYCFLFYCFQLDFAA